MTAQRRLSPFLRYFPGLGLLAYFLTTFALFLIWPVNWQIYRSSTWFELTAYVLTCFAIVWITFSIGAAKDDHPVPRQDARRTILLGSILTIVLLTPSCYYYTGSFPWQVLDALANQGDAYREYQEQLRETAGSRIFISALRGISAPWTFAVIPLGLIHWRSLTLPYRVLVGLSLLSAIIFSALRGTDKESADLFVISLAAFMILLARNSLVADGLQLNRFLKGALIIAVVLGMGANLYTQRKAERLGGTEDRIAVCANDTIMCADIDEDMIAWLPREARFSLSMFVISTTQGYYGLAISMEKDFRSTYGVGHSPAAINLYELVTGDEQMITRTYTYRNGFEGWSHLNFWSSLMAWLANDVGFVGALFVLALIGFATGRAWIGAVLARSDAATVLVAAFAIILLYLPVNNQFFASYDGYFVLMYWVFRWLVEPFAAIKTGGFAIGAPNGRP